MKESPFSMRAGCEDSEYHLLYTDDMYCGLITIALVLNNAMLAGG